MSKHPRPPFAPGDPAAREAGRKGGSRPKKLHRAASGAFTGSVFDVMDWGGMTGPTWEPWRSVLRTSLGVPPSGQDLVFFRAHTNRETPPAGQVSESWVVAGRRGGKSRVSGLVGLTKALQFDAHTRLAPGELGVVPIVAADQKQARVVMHYVRALCALPEIKPYVHRILRDTIELKNGLNCEVHTASYRTLRGYTIIAAVLDEVAFWRDESTSENPDSAILDALRPGMSTVPDALLLAISSPYARKGEVWTTYDRYYGQDDPHIVVWNCDTRSLNPVVAERVIARAFEEDPVSAASEYGADGRVVFRQDVEAFLDAEAIRAVTVPDRRELPPRPGTRYVGFVDPSGGSQDSFTVAIAHREGEHAVLDVVRERRPPFSPDAVVKEYADLLRSYGVTTVQGDRYAGEWPRERFKAHGVRYEPCERVKSDLYRELVAPVNAGRVELLDLPALRAQLVGLERRVARGGKDSIDHAPGARDDLANSAAGALGLVLPTATKGKRVWFSGMTDDEPAPATKEDSRRAWRRGQAEAMNELVRIATEDGEREARRAHEQGRRARSETLGAGEFLDSLGHDLRKEQEQ